MITVVSGGGRGILLRGLKNTLKINARDVLYIYIYIYIYVTVKLSYFSMYFHMLPHVTAIFYKKT